MGRPPNKNYQLGENVFAIQVGTHIEHPARVLLNPEQVLERPVQSFSNKEDSSSSSMIPVCWDSTGLIDWIPLNNLRYMDDRRSRRTPDRPKRNPDRPKRTMERPSTPEPPSKTRKMTPEEEEEEASFEQPIPRKNHTKVAPKSSVYPKSSSSRPPADDKSDSTESKAEDGKLLATQAIPNSPNVFCPHVARVQSILGSEPSRLQLLFKGGEIIQKEQRDGTYRLYKIERATTDGKIFGRELKFKEKDKQDLTEELGGAVRLASAMVLPYL